jgi:hypothetical protein
MSALKIDNLNVSESILEELNNPESIVGGLQLQAEIPVVWPIPTVEPIVCFEPEDM